MTRSDAPPDPATAHAWTALGGDPALLGNVAYRAVSGGLPARLPVAELARATVGVCSLAAAELGARRSGGAVPEVRVDEGAVATAFVSERHLRIDGRKPTNFAPLSGFWRAADGWVRTHANYPHHRARLLAALGLSGDSGPDELAAALAGRPARAIQETVYAGGGLAVAVAEPGESEIPLGGLPLIESRWIGEGAPRPLPEAALPASGVRVLDLTRVIAGPVATRTLALLGADVLRIDSPGLPEDPDAHADTGFGKRSAALDLGAPEGRRTLEALLADADVVVTGYRPGALDRFGLAPDALLERHPGLIVAQLCAWGWSGPWVGRRGFDSLVQAATGIAAIEAKADADGHPGVLPAQALDHGTGYLLAAGVLRGLTARQEVGGGGHLRLSLAGTASWLLHGIAPVPRGGGSAYDPAPWLAETVSGLGTLRYACSPIAFPDGSVDGPLDWARPPGRLGVDAPRWL
ncbi:CoA transferase [Streptomyces antimycoticus]|uniref:CoA transferase n=1 Tax=Streptomyces antimycoticus TaxID=68175 RepID=UPI0034142EA2